MGLLKCCISHAAAFLHKCVQMNAGGMWWRHKWKVERQLLGDKWPSSGFIFRLFQTQSCTPYMVKTVVIITLEFFCHAYGPCLNWVWCLCLTSVGDTLKLAGNGERNVEPGEHQKYLHISKLRSLGAVQSERHHQLSNLTCHKYTQHLFDNCPEVKWCFEE